MDRSIIWSSLADNDLSNILNYLYEKWGGKVVNDFIEILDHILNQLIINPKQFPVINKQTKIRKCVITKHNSLYYHIRQNTIEILRIYDSRQDPEKLEFYF
ncbi:MAG: type II toxin-antitoxin system RelE/ParE family toxin [Chlorobi bacterium]|nr:type II toxin-antitoxin system RelE/ParE family toxin [Chlorobiota bacterium]